MASRTISDIQKPLGLTTRRWLRIGVQAAIAAIVAVLLTQAVILVLWPELAAFKPLDNFARTALFTLIPALAATGLFAWLVKNREHPQSKFLWIAAIVLLLSFIPDFLLPLPNRTIPGSLAAAFLHIIAGIVIILMILNGYAHSVRASDG